jgi:hypothetical protein
MAVIVLEVISVIFCGSLHKNHTILLHPGHKTYTTFVFLDKIKKRTVLTNRVLIPIVDKFDAGRRRKVKIPTSIPSKIDTILHQLSDRVRTQTKMVLDKSLTWK